MYIQRMLDDVKAKMGTSEREFLDSTTRLIESGVVHIIGWVNCPDGAREPCLAVKPLEEYYKAYEVEAMLPDEAHELGFTEERFLVPPKDGGLVIWKDFVKKRRSK